MFMKNLRQIISLILFIILGTSAVFNILYVAGITDRRLMQAGVLIFIGAAFLTGLSGIILKEIKKEDRVTLNFLTPLKEIGALYVLALIIWVVTYAVVIIFGQNMIITGNI